MDNFKKSGTKYLVDRAVRGETIIENDDDYYISVGYLWGLVVMSGKYMLPISHKYINPLLNANSDEILKNRFKQVKQREKIQLKNEWKIKILDSILSYEPENKLVRNNYDVQQCILLGFLRVFAK